MWNAVPTQKSTKFIQHTDLDFSKTMENIINFINVSNNDKNRQPCGCLFFTFCYITPQLSTTVAIAASAQTTAWSMVSNSFRLPLSACSAADVRPVLTALASCRSKHS